MKLIKLFKEILEEGTRRIPATNSFEVEVPDKTHLSHRWNLKEEE